MTAGEQLAILMERLCAAYWLMTAMQKQPHSFAGVSLYASEAYTLMTITQYEGISQTQLSQLLARTKGATSAMVDRLAGKGLVCRQRVEGDQRRYLLSVTPLGRQVSQELSRSYLLQGEEAAKALSLSSQDLEAADRVIQALAEYCSHRYRDGRPGG